MSLSNFQKGKDSESISFTSIIKSYREKLIFQILEDQMSNDVKKITDLVNDLLPNENFYSFKLDDTFDDEREELEETEIVRIIEDNVQNGGHLIKKKPGVLEESDALIPVRIPNDQRK